MNTHTVPDPVHRGHAHDVDLEDTFDFLNTDDTENGFPVDKLPTLDDALAWFVDRGVIHVEGANRVRAQMSSNDPLMARDLARVHAVRSALREVAHSIAEKSARRTPAPSKPSIGRSTPGRSSSSFRGPMAAMSTIAMSAIRSTTPSPDSPTRS